MSKTERAWRQFVLFLRLGGGRIVETSRCKGISCQRHKQWMKDVGQDSDKRWNFRKVLWEVNFEPQDRRDIRSL